MLERPVPEELDVVGCADALAGLVAEQRLVGARRLAYAAHWADLHGPTPRDETDSPDAESAETHSRLAPEAGTESDGHHSPTREAPLRSRIAKRIRFRPGGSDGTPLVSEFAADELGALLEMTTVSGANLMADALDLRHRHPRLWDAVLTGRVEDWKARKVAHATAAADLSLALARRVDEETVDAVVGLPFTRAMNVVEARVLAADPEQAELQRRIEEERRYVSVGRSRAHGLRTLIARTTAGEVARLDAMVAHVADLLGAAGDTDAVGVRRAKALGVLANPAQACLLLAGRKTDPEPATEHTGSRDAGPHHRSESAGTLFTLDSGSEGPEPDAGPTAVQLGVAFGQVLAELDAGAWQRLRPRSVLYLHVAEEAVRGPLPGGDRGVPGGDRGVIRVEGPGPASGPITPAQLRAWLANDHVTVRPVLDPLGQTPVDAYEIPERHREATILLNPFEIFPFGTLAARRADLDHNSAYRKRRREQTRPDNLGPLGRGHHRAKTIGGFSLHQPLPGMYLWRTPTGHWFQVDHRGTRSLGRRTPEIITQLSAPVRMSRMDLAFTELVTAA